MLTTYIIGVCVSALVITYMLSSTTYYMVFERQMEQTIENIPDCDID